MHTAESVPGVWILRVVLGYAILLHICRYTSTTMPELFTLVTIGQALDRLLPLIAPLGRGERVAALDALGRTTAEELRAPVDLPAFARSAMDGFAVRAADTYGASEGLPAYLVLAGEVPMGRPADVAVGPGEAARVHTGGMLPRGCDAVVLGCTEIPLLVTPEVSPLPTLDSTRLLAVAAVAHALA